MLCSWIRSHSISTFQRIIVLRYNKQNVQISYTLTNKYYYSYDAAIYQHTLCHNTLDLY